MEPAERKHLNVNFSLLEEPLLSQIKQDFPNYTEGLVRGNPGGYICSPRYGERAEDVYNFRVRSDDTWVVTFAKCGTTWAQELVWLVNNNCDFEKAKSVDLDFRFPFLEFSLLPPKEVAEYMEASSPPGPFHSFDKIADLPSPRFIKSHSPLYLLPPDLPDTAKVVYVARNPKDVIVSYFHHHKLIKFHYFDKGVEEFADYFIKDLVMYSPFLEHILEAWNKRHHPNLLFLFFEDMKADLAGQVKKVADFFGKQFTEQQLAALVEHLRFDNFSKNESVNKARGKETGFMDPQASNNFVRKGKTGDWKNHFSPELNARIDQWIEDNLRDTDLRFVTQLDKQD